MADKQFNMVPLDFCFVGDADSFCNLPGNQRADSKNSFAEKDFIIVCFWINFMMKKEEQTLLFFCN